MRAHPPCSHLGSQVCPALPIRRSHPAPSMSCCHQPEASSSTSMAQRVCNQGLDLPVPGREALSCHGALPMPHRALCTARKHCPAVSLVLMDLNASCLRHCPCCTASWHPPGWQPPAAQGHRLRCRRSRQCGVGSALPWAEEQPSVKCHLQTSGLIFCCFVKEQQSSGPAKNCQDYYGYFCQPSPLQCFACQALDCKGKRGARTGSCERGVADAKSPSNPAGEGRRLRDCVRKCLRCPGSTAGPALPLPWGCAAAGTL